MLQSFFKLNGTGHAEITSAEDLLHLITDRRAVEHAKYIPDVLELRRPLNVIKNIAFRNVSFKDTRLIGLEFHACTFDDCLFLGTVFELCEFHDTSFTGCNPYKTRFVNTYIDPLVFRNLLNSSKHANIGVYLFQQLRANALNTHQPEFASDADFLFEVWRRHELRYKWRRKRVSLVPFVCEFCKSLLYEWTIGFGHSFTRFAICSLILFTAIVILNHSFWVNFDVTGAVDKRNHPTIASAYYTAITLTTVGYGDITPKTVLGMMLASCEAILGFLWFALLASMFVKKVSR
jgi:hypothetical protein